MSGRVAVILLGSCIRALYTMGRAGTHVPADRRGYLSWGVTSVDTELNVHSISTPAYLLNAPFSLSAEIVNNAWMGDMSEAERRVDRSRAFDQFMALYRAISETAIVYLLPSWPGLQDQPYVANLGVVLPGGPQPTVVISRFRSEPRRGEAEVGRRFFELMRFEVAAPPAFTGVQEVGGEEIFFEGEADLKYLCDNVFVGAHGIRTSRSAHRWFADTFGIKVIPLELPNERQYHLDCCVLPLSPRAAIVCTAGIDRATVSEIERHVEIVDVPGDAGMHGATNCLLCGGKLLYMTNIDELSRTHEHYAGEKAKIDYLETLCSRVSVEPRSIDLSEFAKSGADLSCMVMHLNYAGHLASDIGKPGSGGA